MKVDYAAIADRAVQIIGSADPSQTQTAYDTMVAETTTKQLTTKRESELDIMRRLGRTDADTILTKIETAAGSERLVRMIRSEGGIDLAHPETVTTINEMVAGGAISQAEVDSLMASTEETVPAWPGLRPGYIQNALEKRQRGDI